MASGSPSSSSPVRRATSVEAFGKRRHLAAAGDGQEGDSGTEHGQDGGGRRGLGAERQVRGGAGGGRRRDRERRGGNHLDFGRGDGGGRRDRAQLRGGGGGGDGRGSGGGGRHGSR